jgi:ribonuclease G
LPWFRRRKESAVEAQPAAPEAHEPDPVVDRAEPDSATTDPNKPKRRRGSRGGRNRKKPGTGTGTSTGANATTDAPARAEKAEKPEPSQRSQRSQRNLSQRQERRRDQTQRRRREPQRRAPLPAAKRELLVSVDVGEKRVAILEDGQAAEVYLERPERRSIAGNIYLGTVDNVLPGMEAAFVEIGLEKNGFLYVDEIVGPEIERGHGRKIQDLISRGQTILVQAVKDPMKTKGARLTTQISLPGRFVVFVPQGEGLGVSRRLEDDERTRLKDILKKLNLKEGGVIVRTAAEGASEEDIERDLVFLQRLWKSIQAQAKTASAPELVYQEAELPLRVVRDLFTGDFEKAYVDDDRTFKRITGYLKKTSPHMAERVVRYKEPAPLLEQFGVEQEIKSTLQRRVDLPSGGYLIFDYAEAFTVIDVNTGRFVGGRGKNAGGRLEDTITKNNLEAVKEVVRQLRLRDIGGIIVIDFIDMANPKNRSTVEEALRNELERDRTKTYVVEISPLGLVEMTRQNVTDGPREVMTRKCPTCGGDGIVYSEASAAIDVERRTRSPRR